MKKDRSAAAANISVKGAKCRKRNKSLLSTKPIGAQISCFWLYYTALLAERQTSEISDNWHKPMPFPELKEVADLGSDLREKMSMSCVMP